MGMRLKLLALTFLTAVSAAYAAADAAPTPAAGSADGRARVGRHSPLAAADAALRSAEADIEEYRLKPEDARRRDAAVCGADFTMDGVMGLFGGGRLPIWAAPENDEIIIDSVGYYQCRAYAAGDRKSCVPLKALAMTYDPGSWTGDPEGGAHWDLGCYGHINEMRLVRSYVTRSPDFEKICAPTLTETQEFEDQEFASADIARVCRVIAAGGRDVAAACADISRYYIDKDDVKKCAPMLRRLQGDAGACVPGESVEVFDRCRSYAAFRRAYDAKDAHLCEDLPVCQILMGEGPGACALYARRFRDLFCVSPQERVARARSELERAVRLTGQAQGADQMELDGVRAREAAARTALAHLAKERHE